MSDEDWLILRPFVAQKASLAEIEEKWSLKDVFKVHEAMDVEEEIQEYLHSKTRARRR